MIRNRKLNRLHGYDYSQDNLYFVTSCVQDRICCLGKITNGKMQTNTYGKIAETQWFWLAKQYPYIILHAFVVMPNHIHGIIEINRECVPVGTGRDLSLHRNPSPQHDAAANAPTSPKFKSLSEIMGAYKTTVSKQIHRAGFPGFKWQRSFYDNIIRNETAYDNISRYIRNNPSQWNVDRFFE